MRNLEKATESLFEQGLLRNVAIRVGKRDTVLADLRKTADDGFAVGDNTLFDMASVTKIVAVTSLALIAIDRGLMNPEDRVEKYFPCPEDKRTLTVGNLLTHTMGIGHKNLTSDGYTYDNVWELILKIPSDIPIGSEVLYSCPGFILLGKLLEKIFGKPLNELFDELVAKPLGMKHSGFLPDTGEGKYIVNSNPTEEMRGVVNDYNCRYLGGVAGNAGLFSCISDMTKYAQMLISGGEPLFSRKIFELARRNHTPGMAQSRGLGFLYVDDNYAQTGGLFPVGSIGHCGHTGQSVFVCPESGLYAIILSDATASGIRKFGETRYDEVMKMRNLLHGAVLKDIQG